MSTINFSLDGSPSKDVACEAIDCLNSESLTQYFFSGLGVVYMRDRIHVQNAKQNAVMMCAIFFLFQTSARYYFGQSLY